MTSRRWWGIILVVGMLAWFAPAAFGQDEMPSRPDHTQAGRPGATRPHSQPQNKLDEPETSIKAGTRINAELESGVDAQTAKPGDKVVARVTQNVKQNGREVVHKGDELIGHVTQVQADATGKAGSRLAVTFDRLASGGSETSLNAVLNSVFSARGEAGPAESPIMEPMESRPMAAPAGGGARGGLLGGAVGGVGSTVGSTLGAAGSTVGQAGSAVGVQSNTSARNSTSAGLVTPVRSIHLSSDAGAQNQTGLNSVLSTKHGNLRLDSGTRVEFRTQASTETASRH